MSGDKLTRGEFLKTAAACAGGLALAPGWLAVKAVPAGVAALPEFPAYERLGRLAAPQAELKLHADIDSPTVGKLFEDTVVPWLREVVGKRPLWHSQRFVETPDGYLYAPNLQPVKNQPNQAVKTLVNPDGMWVEVTVPYVELTLANPPARSPWLQGGGKPRLYYSQIMWVDQVRTDEQGQTWYRVNERYGTYGDIFWAAAEAFRPLTAADTQPINAEVQEKRVEVNVTYQTLACYEGNEEVYFARVSTGAKFDAQGNAVDEWSTPVGPHNIWRKLVSVHMSGGSTGGGYDLPGIGWTSLFSGNGVAIHSTFWHNNFGVPMSHGCVNARPEDAQWVFRWTHPQVDAASGDVTISGTGSTKVVVIEG